MIFCAPLPFLVFVKLERSAGKKSQLPKAFTPGNKIRSVRSNASVLFCDALRSDVH